MATTVADADVVIHADVSRFARELESKIQPIVRRIRASIEVDADTSQIDDDVRAAKRRIERGRPATINVNVNINERTIRTTERRVIRSFDTVGTRAGVTFTSAFSRGLAPLQAIGRRAFSFLRFATDEAFLLPVIAIGITAITKAVLALLPLAFALPGAFVAIAGAAGAVFIGLRNVQEALTGDQEALNKLAPAAREAVETLRGFIPVLRDIQQSVQQRLFSGLAEPLQRLAENVLPGARAALEGVATAINTAVVGSLQVLNSESGKIRLDEIFKSVENSVTALSAAVPSITNALLEVTAAGARIFEQIAPRIAQEIQKVSDNIADFAASGRLEKSFEDAVVFAKDLFETMKQVFDIANTIGTAVLEGFSSLVPGGSDTEKLKAFNNALQDLADFLKDPFVQEGLRGIGVALFALIFVVGTIALAFGLLVAAIVRVINFLINLRDTIDGFFLGLDQRISTFATSVVNFFQQLPGRIATALGTLISTVASIFTGLFDLLRGSILPTGTSEVTNSFAALPGRILGALASLGGLLFNLFTAAFNSVVSAINHGINVAVGLAGSIPGRIVGALGDLSGRLFNAGASAVQGLINGLLSKLNALRSAASRVAGAIRNLFPGSPAKEGPLSGRGAPFFSGQAIPRDMARGLLEGEGLLVAASTQAAARIASTFDELIRGLATGRFVSRSGTVGLPAFGDGGVVTKPTVALVGEKGPEAIVPLQKTSSRASTTSIQKTLSPTINIHPPSGDPDAITSAVLRRLAAVGGY